MPSIRCRFYEDDGTGSCPRLGRCEYIHPSEPAWATAPRSNSFSNTRGIPTTNTKLPQPLGKRTREERKFRCRFFGEDGQPINGGCTRNGCSFVHPFDQEWAIAIPDRNIGTYGRTLDPRRRDAGYENRKPGGAMNDNIRGGSGWDTPVSIGGDGWGGGGASTSGSGWGPAANDSMDLDSGTHSWGSTPDGGGGGWASPVSEANIMKPSSTMDYAAKDSGGSGWGSASNSGGGWSSHTGEAKTNETMKPNPTMEHNAGDSGRLSSDLGKPKKKTLASGWGVPSLGIQGSDFSLQAPWETSVPPEASASSWGDSIMSEREMLGGGEVALEAQKPTSGWEGSTTDNRNDTAASVAAGYSYNTGVWPPNSATVASLEDDAVHKRSARSTNKPSLSSQTASSHDRNFVLDKSESAPTTWEASSIPVSPPSPSLANSSHRSGTSSSLPINQWLTQQPKNREEKRALLEAVVEATVQAVDTQNKLSALKDKREAWKRVMNSEHHSHASRTSREILEATRDDTEKDIRQLESTNSELVAALGQLLPSAFDISEWRRVEDLRVQARDIRRSFQELLSDNSGAPPTERRRPSPEMVELFERRLSQVEKKLDDHEKSISSSQILDMVMERMAEKTKALAERIEANGESDSMEELQKTVDACDESLTMQMQSLETFKEKIDGEFMSELVLIAGDVATTINRGAYLEASTSESERVTLAMKTQAEEFKAHLHQSSERIRNLELHNHDLREDIKNNSAHSNRETFDMAELQSRINSLIDERIVDMKQEVEYALQRNRAEIAVGLDEQFNSLSEETWAQLQASISVTDVLCDYLVNYSARQDAGNPT